ncbi:hypothetical protein I8752_07125 [Nostocaceae cyanobacterium CENA369]|uniref:Uncharacterized protein n=1 Tax=Dendronalium phyllosphericum CENA369 TaxID=1725256 RepID=A0A8J7HYU6_9NOST|nr:hypothetical protein [Dendronalium phyllosphericum CENA369]
MRASLKSRNTKSILQLSAQGGRSGAVPFHHTGDVIVYRLHLYQKNQKMQQPSK